LRTLKEQQVIWPLDRKVLLSR